MNAVLAFEDGSVYRGKAFGATKTVLGEASFNTSVMGYEELLTDPSNYKNILIMTFVEIGCYGINEEDVESNSIKASGLVVAQNCEVPSNWRSKMSLNEFLLKHDVPAISGVDTRALTTKLREKGTLKACLSTEDISDEEAVRKAKEWKGLDGVDSVSEVSCNAPYKFEADLTPFTVGGVHICTKPRTQPLFKCAAIDFGAKLSLLKSLAYSGFDVTVFPANTTAEEIEKFAPDALFLSNGAGDPSAVEYAHSAVSKLIKKYPTLAIGFGHQVVAHALGAKTYKLKFGHHGANHPVRNLASDKVKITTQNHNYAVDAESLESGGGTVTEVNHTDQTLQGLSYKDLPLLSVQYHPESAPSINPNYIFDEFYKLVKNTLGK